RELMETVWPGITVGEANLRVHIAELRDALGDGKEGTRYIVTSAGRGYRFVAPVSRSNNRDDRRVPSGATLSPSNLPACLARMVGRADDTLMLSTQLAATRFVTVVGAGGVGKTTITVAVAYDLMPVFADALFFIDLGALNDPKLVATSLAAVLGLSVQSVDP